MGKIIKYHGHTGDSGKKLSPTYRTWLSMKQRCQNTNHPAYHKYGGRGIKICNRWNLFHLFLKDMGERPKGKTLDRINNNGNYSKNNCRWATYFEQGNNKRTNVKLKISSNEYSIGEASKKFSIGRSVLKRLSKNGIEPSEDELSSMFKKPLKSILFPVEKFIKDIQNIESRNMRIVYLHKKGCAGSDISRYYNISKQRVHQICKRYSH